MTHILSEMRLAGLFPGSVKMDQLRDFLRNNGVSEPDLLKNDLRVIHYLLAEVNFNMISLKKGHMNMDEAYDPKLEEAPQKRVVFMSYRMMNIDIFSPDKDMHLKNMRTESDTTFSGKMRKGEGFFDSIPRIVKEHLDISGIEGWNDSLVYPTGQYTVNGVESKEYAGIILSQCYFWNYDVILNDCQFNPSGYDFFHRTGLFGNKFVWERIAEWEARKNKQASLVEVI